MNTIGQNKDEKIRDKIWFETYDCNKAEKTATDYTEKKLLPLKES